MLRSLKQMSKFLGAVSQPKPSYHSGCHPSTTQSYGIHSPPQFQLFRWSRSIANIVPSAATPLKDSATANSSLQTSTDVNPNTATSPPVRQWPGLADWRAHKIDSRRQWGDTKQPIINPELEQRITQAQVVLPSTLAECGHLVLTTADPRTKALLTHAAWGAFANGQIDTTGISKAPEAPARPAIPELVPPKQIPSMKKTTLPINVYMLHNLAHVELNAIDLAWDTVVRFSSLGLPRQFYADFAKVADDESRHLTWCLQRLEELGYFYGCMPAHNLLWEGCQLSRTDIRDRLALVPMSQEARGLDAGGRLTDRLVGSGDNRSAAIVSRITLEEQAHVAVGVTWFGAVCGALKIDPGFTFRGALMRLCPDLLKPPFNHVTRGQVGLEREWYDPEVWTTDSTGICMDSSIGSTSDDDGNGGGGNGGMEKKEEVEEAMQQLRVRLQSMMEVEAEMCEN